MLQKHSEDAAQKVPIMNLSIPASYSTHEYDIKNCVKVNVNDYD